MNIKNISQKVAIYVENLLQEELNNEINDQMSEDYQSEINTELEAFENGIDDDESIIDMDDSDINDQTMKFLAHRDKK